MKKVESAMRPEYKPSDFVKLERGKFFKESANSTSVALIGSKQAAASPTFEEVNRPRSDLLTLADESARIKG